MSKASQRKQSAAHNRSKKREEELLSDSDLGPIMALLRMDIEKAATNPKLFWSQFIDPGDGKKPHPDDHVALEIFNLMKPLYEHWSGGSRVDRDMVAFPAPSLLTRVFRSGGLDFQNWHCALHDLGPSFSDVSGHMKHIDGEFIQDPSIIRGWALGISIPMTPAPLYLVCSTPSGATHSAVYIDGSWYSSKSRRVFGMVLSLVAFSGGRLIEMDESLRERLGPRSEHIEFAVKRGWLAAPSGDLPESCAVPGTSVGSSTIISQFSAPYVYQAMHLAENMIGMQKKLDEQRVEVDTKLRNQLTKRDADIRTLEAQLDQVRGENRRLQHKVLSATRGESSSIAAPAVDEPASAEIAIADRMTAFFSV